MRRLFLIVAVTTVAVAKPELYREKEDFQYSRSSTDEGSKAGFYGAQRGNMGGNYERAHNMDGLAQHQMSSLVRQVEGELGDASKTKTGSVFSSANSRGVYGSGNYDVSNLEGRNFQEGVSYDKSHSSLSSQGYNGHASSALHNTGYTSNHAQNSRYSGYQGSEHSKQTLQSSNLQAAEDVNSGSAYGYDRQAGYSSGHHSESAYHGQNAYDHSNSDVYNSRGHGSNIQSRLVSATPVRVVLRPGIRVAVPVAAQTYDASHSASLIDQNAINTEAEVLGTNNHQGHSPSSNAKHYESAYSYHKEWEKHDTKPMAVPLAVPTVNPFPKNSELYDDTQAAHIADDRYHVNEADYQNTHSSNRYSANVKSASSSQTKQQYDYNSGGHSSLSGANSNAYTHSAYNSGATAADLTNLVGDSKPKNYQSSFSYHKSWERQGDPYEIKPYSNGAYDGQASQRLTAASNNQAYTSHQYGSQYKNSHQSYSRGSIVDCDCDEDEHIRVARSYNVDQNQQYDSVLHNKEIYEGQEELGQQAQSGWENLEELGQQTQSKWDQLEDLGQQTQNKWDNLENLGQQTQNTWDKLEDAGQQIQSKSDKLEALGQQTQDTWDKLNKDGQKIQAEKLEDLGQQSQSKWDTLETGQVQNQENLEQQFRNEWDNLKQTEQQEQNEWKNSNVQKQGNDFPEKNHSHANEFQIFNQQAQSEMSLKDKNDQGFIQPIQSTWNQLDTSRITEIDDRNTEKQSPTQKDNEKVNGYKEKVWKQFSGSENLNAFPQNKEKVLNENNKNNKTFDSDEQGKQSNNVQQISNNDGSGSETNTNKQYEVSSFNNAGFYPWSFGNDQNQQQNNRNYNYYQALHGYHSHRQNEWVNQFTNNNNNNVYSNYNSYTKPQTTYLQNLWDKINDHDNEFLVNQDNTNVNGNAFSNSNSNSQQLNQSWRQIQSYDFASNLGTEKSSSSQNQFRSHYVGYRPWQSTIYDETSTLSTTNKPKEKQVQENVRPSDIGRGDIGPEDSSIHTITSTEKNYSDKTNTQIITTDAINKYHKTPEEIEALSLTRGTVDRLQNSQEHNTNQNSNEQSDKKLSVISLTQQKWLEEQRQHGNIQNDKVNLVSSSTSGTISTTSDSKFTTGDQTQNRGSLNDGFLSTHFYNNKPHNQIANHNSHDSVTNDQAPEEIDQQNTDQQSQDFAQKNEDFSQQQSNVEQLENFMSTDVAQKQLSKQETEQNMEQFEDFGQQSENLDQQSQTAWGQDLENLQESNAQQKENFEILNNDQKQDFYGQYHATNYDQEQQSETQQIENFKPSNNYQKQDFYEQKYHSSKEQRENKEQQNNQGTKLQTNLQKNDDAKVSIPEEVATTEKPGFWKSVGSKFTNAKDKVASWFRGS